MGSTRSVLAALLLASGVAYADEPPLDRGWSRAFSSPAIDKQVKCAVRWRGGIVIGGSFDLAGTVAAKNLAWWNGSRWYDLGGADGTVNCLAVIRDTLIIGGEFSRAGGIDAPGIARWTGSKWLPMGDGLIQAYGSGVKAVTTFRGDLVAIGGFVASGTTPLPGAARWDGTRWRALGQGWPSGTGTVAAVYHDRLYVAGYFDTVEGVACQGFAAWDGAHWTPVPWTAPNLPYFNTVSALAVAHDLLYAGGSFDTAGTVPAHRVAAWNGNSWTAVDLPGFAFDVTALASRGGKLVAAAYTSGLWEWDGVTWTPQNSNLNDGYVTSLLEDDAGSVVTGYVAAYNQAKGELLGSGVLVRAGGDWAPLQTWSSDMHGFPPLSGVRAITRYAGDIVATGGIEFVADHSRWSRVSGLARWDGAAWSAFPGWPGGAFGANGLAVSGDTLVAIGYFASGGVGEVPGFLYDGSRWTQLDTLSGQFFSPTWFRGSLYVGAFPSTSVQFRRGGVYRLDGTHWTEIGEITATGNLPAVFALAVHADRLVAGGWFDHIDGVAAQSVAAWDGTTWSALGGLQPDTYTPVITTLADVNDTLYAGGTMGPPGYEAVARWNESAWELIGPTGHAWALASFNGRLLASGIENGTGAYVVQSLNGSNWNTFATLNDIAIAIFPDGDDLWMAGGFSLVDGVPSSRIAHWQHATPSSSHPFALSPGYPNPMRESVAFSYSLPSAGEILLTVSDARGRHVATLDSGPRDPGDHFAEWDGKDAQGRRAPAGVYFVRLTGAAETSRKVVLLP